MRIFLCTCALASVALAVFDVSESSAQKKKKEDTTALPKREDVPKLIGTLKNSTSVSERASAATQLGRLGQIQAMFVRDAIDPLVNAAQKDTEANVRRASVEALGMIAPDPEKIVPVLIDALKDKNLQVNLAAVVALGRYGPEAKSAVPPLREFSKAKPDKKIGQLVSIAIKEITGKKKG